MALDGAARTHAGKVRTSNEDACICRPEAGLFAVVDGMGGEASGEVAAAIAVHALAEVPPVPGIPGEQALSEGMRTARQRILAEADADAGKEGMGAVATAIRFDDDGQSLSLAHVGDTRAYLVHAGGVRLLTHDHVADGPPGSKRQVARDLGRRDLVGDWVETGRARVARGDLVVLASDGLTDVVAEPDLVAEFRRLRADGSSADDIATRLVGMALAGGGPDNVTVVAVRVGAFSRRAPRSPGYLLPAVLGVVGVALVGFGLTRPPVRALFGGGEPMADHIPGEVNGALDLKIAEAADVGSAMVTEVRRGGALRLAGKELQGGDWTVRVADGGSFELVRSVVDVNRQLRVEVSPGGELLLRDVRVANGRVVVHAEDGARVRLHHVLLAEPGSLDKVGPGAAGVVTDDVGVVEAPDPSEAPPQPPSRALTP